MQRVTERADAGTGPINSLAARDESKQAAFREPLVESHGGMMQVLAVIPSYDDIGVTCGRRYRADKFVGHGIKQSQQIMCFAMPGAVIAWVPWIECSVQEMMSPIHEVELDREEIPGLRGKDRARDLTEPLDIESTPLNLCGDVDRAGE